MPATLLLECHGCATTEEVTLEVPIMMLGKRTLPGEWRQVDLDIFCSSRCHLKESPIDLEAALDSAFDCGAKQKQGYLSALSSMTPHGCGKHLGEADEAARKVREEVWPDQREYLLGRLRALIEKEQEQLRAEVRRLRAVSA